MPSKSPSSWIFPLANIALAWTGLCISLILMTGGSAELCRAGSACDAVLHSRYAVLAGLPLAWWGAGFYALLLGCFLIGLNDDRLSRRLGIVATIIVIVGALASTALVAIQIFILRAVCPLCMASAGVALLLCVLCAFAPDEVQLTPRQHALGYFIIFGISICFGTALTASRREAAVVLSIDGERFTETQMLADLQGSLRPGESMIFNAKRDWIDRQIASRVLASEAARRGETEEALLQREVESKITVSESEIDEFLKESGKVNATADRQQAHEALAASKRAALKKSLVSTLSRSHRISVRLPKPPLTNASIDLTLARLDGPPGAPVRLVVFSDFACGYCADLPNTLRKLRAAFPNDLLIGFRYFPATDARSVAAAEAAECAARQGKFWAFHDALFAQGGILDEAALRKAAKAAGLDETAFAECSRSREGRAAVEASAQDAASLGIEGTPSIFLNGRLIGSSRDFDTLSKLVKAELARRPYRPSK